MRGKNKNDIAGDKKRAAGVLLHITSLPSSFGIGDFGPQAAAFVDFLYDHHQQYWQILPLTVTNEAQCYSPYSATSCMAGNTLLISPELLAKDKLLQKRELSNHKITNHGKVNFKKALQAKTFLLEKAFQNFLQQKTSPLHHDFQKFTRHESWWLEDYALYAVIKKTQGNTPWYDWPDDLKHRLRGSLTKFQTAYRRELTKEKWLQFIFFRQWHLLKDYCNSKNIRIFGDLPFYVSYDAADVWTHPEIFAVDNKGNMKGIAGVPPDYFNADGQLWGMPVFKWDVLAKTKYRWWIDRIRKNLELYDLLRFDHFRAFESYWQVPANEKTARNGRWKKGPGTSLFNEIKNEFPAMPFVAEDLGDIDAAVHELRQSFHLPGMKVLQFAFDDDVATAEHIPHNYTENFIAYTGTHDNNTTLGWFKTASEKAVVNLEKYLNKSLSPNQVSLEMIRMAYASVAFVAIIPMQDLLGLDENARINLPASLENNWQWRLKDDQLKRVPAVIKDWVKMFNRHS